MVLKHISTSAGSTSWRHVVFVINFKMQKSQNNTLFNKTLSDVDNNK